MIKRSRVKRMELNSRLLPGTPPSQQFTASPPWRFSTSCHVHDLVQGRLSKTDVPSSGFQSVVCKSSYSLN